MKTIFFILIFSTSALCQQLVGTANNVVYYIDNIERKGKEVKFSGLASKYDTLGDSIVLDLNNYIISEFNANCDTYEWYQTNYSGKKQGVAFKGVFKLEKKVAEKPQIIFKALDMACSEFKLSDAL